MRGGTPSHIEKTGHDNVRISKKTYGFLEDSEDLQFNVPFKSENDQDFFEKLFRNVKKNLQKPVQKYTFLRRRRNLRRVPTTEEAGGAH